jgi:hypothetical protein
MAPTPHVPTLPTVSATDVVDAYLDQLAAARIGHSELFAPGATFVATVPHWRFRVDGAGPIRAELDRWFAHPTRLGPQRRLPTRDGAVLVLGLRWDEDGQTWGGHQVHVLTIADGRIQHLEVACGGRWGPDLLAQMPSGVDAG